MEDLCDMPLAERRRLLLRSTRPFPSSRAPCTPVLARGVPIQRATSGAKDWLGLPRGVRFNPSDADLLWHLHAKVGKGSSDPHPFIHEFITCLDEFDRFGYTHPWNLPGIKEDGPTYFFHKSFKTCGSENGKHSNVPDDISEDVCWQKSGKVKPLIFDEVHQGYKTIMTLHISMKETRSLLTKGSSKGHWVMHQYHLGTTAKVEEGEFVVSKIFSRRINHANQKGADTAQEAVEAVPMEHDTVKDDHDTKYSQPLKGQRLTDQQINVHEVLDSLPPSTGSAVKIEPLEEIFADNGLESNGGRHANSSLEQIGRKLASFTETVWSNGTDYTSRAKVKEESDDGLSKDTVDSQASHLHQRRKRKKTTTHSVEQALEEDAPGLLEVLRERGISADEMKLYGAMEDDEAPEGDNFRELETVIHKIYSAQASLFRFSLARHIKGSKVVYCVACLLSLVEQSRYMQFRKVRTEWGWCRDLQSFIFVFQDHNRIVLERPEYGYATYFFGIVDSLPIDWQIKRIVTTMTVISCSRTTLIEDKPLVIGQDLTEEEARVLEEYGWSSNRGLGTMLDYRHRVVHDKKNDEWDIIQWRVKIGKMLVDGLDSGRTVLSKLPTQFMNNTGSSNCFVKKEED